MLLVSDIGNSSINSAVYSEDNLLRTFRIPSDISIEEIELLLEENTVGYQIDACIISSVADSVKEKLKTAIKKIYRIIPVELSSSLNLGFKLNVDKPELVGNDRIANAAGARKKYKFPIIVVDMGTATTFDIINDEGDFIGGVIMPGLKLQFESLSRNTAQLPLIELTESLNAIGNNTENSILSGVIRGHACAIEGLISSCANELGKIPTIVGTGGFAECISKYIPNVFNNIDTNLTLDGLKIIYYNNL